MGINDSEDGENSYLKYEKNCYRIKMIGELSLPLSVVLIFGGIVLASTDIIPSKKKKKIIP